MSRATKLEFLFAIFYHNFFFAELIFEIFPILFEKCIQHIFMRFFFVQILLSIF